MRVNLAGIPTEAQSKFMDLNSCHFRFSMDLASYGLSWELKSYMRRRSALYVVASEALHDANDARLGLRCITRITRPHVHSFSDPRFGALSPTKLRVRPLKLCLFATSPPTPP